MTKKDNKHKHSPARLYEFIPDEWKMNNRALPNEKKRLHFDHYKYV